MQREIINEHRIKAIFNQLRINQRKVKFIIDLTEYQTVVRNVSDINVELEFPYHDRVENLKQAELTFHHEKHIYHCETDIIEVIPTRSILITLPITLIRWQPRKHPRVDLDNELSLSFKLIKTREELQINPSIPFRLRELYKSLYADNVDLIKIFAEINTEIKNHSKSGSLNFHKKGEKHSTSILITGKYKKAIVIPDIKNKADFLRDIKSTFYMSYKPFFDDSGWSSIKIEKEIKRLSGMFEARGVEGFIIMPLLLHNQMIGHLFCQGLREDQYVFSEDNIFYLRSLCDIASEAVARFRFKSLYSNSDASFPVTNLSGGGLLFRVEGGNYLLKLLEKGSKLRLYFMINNVPFNVMAEIIRLEYLKDAFNVAVSFDLSGAEENIIKRFVDKKRAETSPMGI